MKNDDTLHAEIDGVKFRLTVLNGKPYVLKRWKRGAHWHWGIVWADWYYGLPTGARAKAIKAMGFYWRNDSENALGWHTVAGAYLGPRRDA